MAEEFFTCEENSPDRVDKILARAFPHKSRALIQRAIESSKVKKKRWYRTRAQDKDISWRRTCFRPINRGKKISQS